MAYEKRIKENKVRIQILTSQIEDLENRLSSRRSLLMERIRALYKQEKEGMMAALVSVSSYQEFLRLSRYMSDIARYDRGLINGYNADMEGLKRKKQEMESAMKELETDKNALVLKENEIAEEKNKKNIILASIRTKRASYERMVKEMEAASARLLEIIKESERRSLPPPIEGRGFSSLLGRLPWPIDGRVISFFGRQRDPEFNMPVFNNGIEIKAEIGEDAKAVYGGRVAYANWFKGYGKLLIINHGAGYYSLYAHLSDIYPKVGDSIKEYQPIGKVGDSGTMNTPALYFELRYKGKPLDPIKWLRRK